MDTSIPSEGMEGAWFGGFWLSVACAVPEIPLESVRATETLRCLAKVQSPGLDLVDADMLVDEGSTQN